MTAKARALAAERRRQRIAANMATAPTVEAVDSAGGQKEERGEEGVCHGGDHRGCSASAEHEEEDDMTRDARHEEEKREEEKVHRLAKEQARLEAQQQEQKMLEAEAARRVNQERLDQERAKHQRILAERKKQAEEAARIQAEIEAARAERERLAAAAAKKLELERLEQERREQDRIREEQRKKEEEEARRLAKEQARLEAERAEREKLAAEAAKKEEQARELADAKADAARAMELAKSIAVDNDDFLPSDVRSAAGLGKNDLLAQYITMSPKMANVADRSGWTPLHEAARAGNLAGVQLLLSAGCDLTSKTGRAGTGGTALWWAVQRYGEDHAVVRLLRAHGALEEGPA